MEALRNWDEALLRFCNQTLVGGGSASLWQAVTDTGLFDFQALILVLVLWKERRDRPPLLLAALLGGLTLYTLVTDQALYRQIPALLLLAALCYPLQYKSAAYGIYGAAAGGIGHIVVKLLVRRDRPSLLEWVHPYENVYTTSSFPSGHAATSFGMAIGIAIALWPQSKAYAGVFLAWACLVGVSRVAVGVHWPTDVLASLGVALVSTAVLKLARRFN